MRKSTIPFLLINFIIAFGISSCGSNPMKGLTQVRLENKVYHCDYFSNPEIDYVYKTNISVYGKELTGIFIAKKISDATHRVVFTTEFGNKLLDFEISETDFKINALVDELDKKILITTLISDFRLLLRSEYNIQQQFGDDNNNILMAKDGNLFDYLYLSKTNGKLLQIKNTSKRKEKINITFTSENNIFANRIVIQHDNLKLRIELNYFKNQ